ncbi:MAG: TonB-dependent receptor [Rhodospirillaceae bacterium]|nr:TonB-dependent receptor [Rhodospirillaceae bacterium]
MSFIGNAIRLSARRSARALALSSVSGLALAVSLVPAHAQTAAPQAAQEPALEEVVITGSRIVRDGYEAPTPVTVVGSEQLESAAKPNVFDAISYLPAFSGNVNLNTSNSNISTGTGGASTLNLRGLGVNRTLVLLDGRRFPNIFVSGGTDAKLFPDLLISRVDVVTGGASAVYGSDAVSGVVNFVLDNEFTGVKGNVMGGVTGRGDHRQYKVAAAAGTPFAAGRGHFLLSADYGYQADMNGNTRAWNQAGYMQVANPAYGTGAGQSLTNPQTLLRFQSGLWAASPGGVIFSGPLKGITFGAGGVPYNFNFGSITTSSFTVGGDWDKATEQGANSLSAGIVDKHLFSHASYDLNDNVTIYADYNYGTVNNTNSVAWTYYLGSNINVKLDNPYLPQSVVAQAQALKLTGLAFGKALHDVPEYASWNQRNSFVYVVGGKGNFEAFDTKWKFDAYLQKGLIKLDLNSPIQVSPPRFALAIDAVRAPNGTIVCRSTLTNPTNGCVPYNLIGTDRNSDAAINYITALPNHPHNSQRQGLTSAAANVSGEPFSDWAGPISLAAAIEWRKETIDGKADPIATAKEWYSTNYISWPHVEQSVVEGNLETVIPLAKDTVWAKSLDFNGAVRLTDYSVSGSVVTWKAGLTYNPIDDIRIRFTQSRDIRAPNLNDLFAPGQQGHGAIADPFKNNQTFEFGSIQGGNTSLKPEKADTSGVGIVVQPQFFPGFSASVDYYSIKLNGAVTNPNTSFILQQCYAGVQIYCPLINRDAAGVLQTINVFPVNSNTLWARGMDVEASYRTSLSNISESLNGDLTLRLVATHVIRLKTLGLTLSDSTGTIGGGGALGRPAPNWNGHFTVSYSNDPIRMNWNLHYVSSGKMFADSIVCAAGSCPTTVPAGLTTYDSGYVPKYYLNDFSIAYALFRDGARSAEVYLNVDNVFDRDPPPVAVSGVAYSPMTEPGIYDVYGRSFRLGVRFRM